MSGLLLKLKIRQGTVSSKGRSYTHVSRGIQTHDLTLREVQDRTHKIAPPLTYWLGFSIISSIMWSTEASTGEEIQTEFRAGPPLAQVCSANVSRVRRSTVESCLGWQTCQAEQVWLLLTIDDRKTADSSCFSWPDSVGRGELQEQEKKLRPQTIRGVPSGVQLGVTPRLQRARQSWLVTICLPAKS
jgi:hypothetical protein